jgi:hypothetical protein
MEEKKNQIKAFAVLGMMIIISLLYYKANVYYMYLVVYIWFGLAYGMMLQYGRFCFASASRDLFAAGVPRMAVGILVNALGPLVTFDIDDELGPLGDCEEVLGPARRGRGVRRLRQPAEGLDSVLEKMPKSLANKNPGVGQHKCYKAYDYNRRGVITKGTIVRTENTCIDLQILEKS